MLIALWNPTMQLSVDGTNEMNWETLPYIFQAL